MIRLADQAFEAIQTPAYVIDEAQLAAVCRRWRAGEITAVAAMKELGLKPNTFYRRVKERGL